MKNNKVQLSEQELTEMMSKAILNKVAERVIYEENGKYKLKGRKNQFNTIEEAFNHLKTIID